MFNKVCMDRQLGGCIFQKEAHSPVIGLLTIPNVDSKRSVVYVDGKKWPYTVRYVGGNPIQLQTMAGSFESVLRQCL